MKNNMGHGVCSHHEWTWVPMNSNRGVRSRDCTVYFISEPFIIVNMGSPFTETHFRTHLRHCCGHLSGLWTVPLENKRLSVSTHAAILECGGWAAMGPHDEKGPCSVLHIDCSFLPSLSSLLSSPPPADFPGETNWFYNNHPHQLLVGDSIQCVPSTTCRELLELYCVESQPTWQTA